MSKLGRELARAIDNGDLAAVDKALRRGANPDDPTPSGRPPLIAAADKGLPEVVTMLLRHGATHTVTSMGLNALNFAVRALVAPPRRHATISVLMAHGMRADERPSPSKVPAWWDALESGDGTLVRLMLNHGVQANRPLTTENFTPLMFAVSNGWEEGVRILLEFGADRASKTVQGATALDFAADIEGADAATRQRIAALVDNRPLPGDKPDTPVNPA